MNKYNINEQAKEMALAIKCDQVSSIELWLAVAYKNGMADGRKEGMEKAIEIRRRLDDKSIRHTK